MMQRGRRFPRAERCPPSEQDTLSGKAASGWRRNLLLACVETEQELTFNAILHQKSTTPEETLNAALTQFTYKQLNHHLMMTFSHLDFFIYLFFCKLGKCCEREAVPLWRIILPWCHRVSPRSPQLWHRWGCGRSWMKRDTALWPSALTCTHRLSALSTVSLTWDCCAVSGVALRTLRHSSVAVGDNIHVYGGLLEGRPTDDLMVFSTGQGECLKLRGL